MDRDDIVTGLRELIVELRAADQVAGIRLVGRDTRDIRLLLGLCHISTLVEAEDLYEEFYPGDVLTQRAVSIVTAILADGPPDAPDAPEPLTL